MAWEGLDTCLPRARASRSSESAAAAAAARPAAAASSQGGSSREQQQIAAAGAVSTNPPVLVAVLQFVALGQQRGREQGHQVEGCADVGRVQIKLGRAQRWHRAAWA